MQELDADVQNVNRAVNVGPGSPGRSALPAGPVAGGARIRPMGQHEADGASATPALTSQDAPLQRCRPPLSAGSEVEQRRLSETCFPAPVESETGARYLVEDAAMANEVTFKSIYVLYVRKNGSTYGWWYHPNRLACEEKAKELPEFEHEIVEYVWVAAG